MASSPVAVSSEEGAEGVPAVEDRRFGCAAFVSISTGEKLIEGGRAPPKRI